MNLLLCLQENLDKLQRNLFSFRVRTGSQSAPLFADSKPDAIEKMRQMRPSLSRKFSSYVLPTPVDAKSSISSSSNNPKPSKVQANLSEPTKNLWHSSPLDQKKHEKDSGDEFSGSIVRSAQSVHKESNSNTASTRLPRPLADNFLSSNRDYISAHSKKIKRYAFSGPLTSDPGPTRPVLVESVQLFSGPLLPSPIPQPRSSSPKLSPTASPTLVSSPKISELHELPRPPTSFPSNSRFLGLVGHSGPLLSRGQKVSSANNLAASSAASPLPMPPPAMTRSFSIPSSGARVAALHVPRTLDSSHGSSISETIASPLIPLALSSSQPSSDCWGCCGYLDQRYFFKPGLFVYLFSYFLLFLFSLIYLNFFLIVKFRQCRKCWSFIYRWQNLCLHLPGLEWYKMEIKIRTHVYNIKNL